MTMMQRLSGVRTMLRSPEVVILATLYSAYAVYIVNRKSVSLCLPALMASGVSTVTAGLIVSGQNAAYAGSKLAGGIASDYFNPRRLLSYGLALCGLTTLIFSYVDGDVAFIGAWFLNGIAHGAGWPACAKILQMAAPAHFGTMWSILSTSVNFAGVLSPLVAAAFVPMLGWRWYLRLISALTIFMGVVCLVTKIEQRSRNRKKVDSGKKTSKANASPPKDGYTRNQLFWNPLLWLVSFSYLIVFCAKTALTDWCQIFFIEQYKMTPDVGSKFTSGMEFGGFIGSLILGYLTDKYIAAKTKRNDDSNVAVYARMICSLICAAGVCVTLHYLCYHVDSESSQMILVLVGSLIGAFTYGQIVMYGIVASTMVPAHLSGTSHSIVSLAANVGAVTAGFPFANFAENHDWRTAFVMLECASAVVVVVILASLNATKTKVKVA